MFIEVEDCDPKTHALCLAMARACLRVIENLLRDDERHLALKEFYIAARNALDERGGS